MEPLHTHTHTHLLVAMHQDNPQLVWDEFSATVHMGIVTGADVLNVNRNTGILKMKYSTDREGAH